jgi:lipopolysaccharide biosynthesis glycosyltransferase
MSSAGRNILHIHIFWDGTKEVMCEFLEPISIYASHSGLSVYLSFYIIDAKAPFQQFFALCSMNRLLLAKMVPHLSRIIYLDTDTLILGDLGVLWEEFNSFSPRAVFGLTKESELELGIGWYETGHLKHFYGSTGVNAGVALIFIEHWPLELDSIIAELALNTKINNQWVLGDQDIINWILFDQPDLVKIIPCSWNLRSDSNCKAEDMSRTILHGNRGQMYTRSPKAQRRMFYDYNQVAQALVENQVRMDSIAKNLDARKKGVQRSLLKRRNGPYQP